MSSKKKPKGDYEVGYGKPPKHTQFPKGQSGNIKGRPKVKKGPVDNVTEILDALVKVRHGKRTVKMGGFEASVRNQVKKALTGGNVDDLIDMLKLMEKYGAITKPVVSDVYRGPIIVPADWDLDEWIDMYNRLGPPPWPGERDGMIEKKMLDALRRNSSAYLEDPYDE